MSDQYTEYHGQEKILADVRADQADPRPRGGPGAAPVQDPRGRTGPRGPPPLRAGDDGNFRSEPADGPRGAAGGREPGAGGDPARRSGRAARAGAAQYRGIA